jgi:hypothetical protein
MLMISISLANPQQAAGNALALPIQDTHVPLARPTENRFCQVVMLVETRRNVKQGGAPGATFC